MGLLALARRGGGLADDQAVGQDHLARGLPVVLLKQRIEHQPHRRLADLGRRDVHGGQRRIRKGAEAQVVVLG